MTRYNSNIYEACARAAHECNRAYCFATGDSSQPSWDDAPDWQKQSCRNGVVGVLERGNTPAQSHANWLAEKEATGWVYGPLKDTLAKTHPCMLPYDDLPPEQRAKDLIFVRVVKAMAEALTEKGDRTISETLTELTELAGRAWAEWAAQARAAEHQAESARRKR